MPTGFRNHGLQVQVIHCGRQRHDADVTVLNPSTDLTAGTQLLAAKGGRVHFDGRRSKAESAERPGCTQRLSAIHRKQRRGHTFNGPYFSARGRSAPRRLGMAEGPIPPPEANV
jgi:hypothetical protein